MRLTQIIKTVCILGLALVLASTVSGSELEITGFFDVTSTYVDDNNDQNEFGLGQAEIELQRQLSPMATTSVELAYHNETNTFDLRSAEIGLNLISNGQGLVSTLDVSAGQFDVPFGLDYHSYRSKDRKLVTAPLVVQMTHNLWNDKGAQMHISSDYGNLVVFGVNGFKSSFEVIDNAQSLATGIPVGATVNTTPASAVGGRFGFVPNAQTELGGSFALGMNESGQDEMLMIGVDAQLSIQQLDIKGEYISHSLNRSLVEETNKGYYLQGTYNLDRTFVIGRLGSIQPEGLDWSTRYTMGAGYAVTEGVEMRFESTLHEDSADNTNILQMVAWF